MDVRDCVEIVGGVPLAVRFWTPVASLGRAHRGAARGAGVHRDVEGVSGGAGDGDRSRGHRLRPGGVRSLRAGAGRARAGLPAPESAWTELPALLQQLDIERPVLFGHSDGGTVALLYAARYPCRVACGRGGPHLGGGGGAGGHPRGGGRSGSADRAPSALPRRADRGGVRPLVCGPGWRRGSARGPSPRTAGHHRVPDDRRCRGLTTTTPRTPTWMPSCSGFPPPRGT
jgi:pimeloyl-ACP methyl ester carboxylesterase